MPISTTSFGSFAGREVKLYTLENANGMRVKITPYGATVTSISLPDGDERAELAAGFDSLNGYFSKAYQENAPYFGCTVGRYASRIKDGKFIIDDKGYQVDVNDGSNHLHGGVGAFDKRLWVVERAEGHNLKLSLHSAAGDGGYPGNLDVSVTYTLTDSNELIIDYTGTTDQATPLSMTNHTYFNLSGFKETIHDHQARIDADAFLQPDATNVPVGEETAVDGHFTDLRQPVRLGDRLDQTETGFETYYRFPSGTETAREVALFTHPASGRELRVLTTEPGALFYTGFFTSDELSRSNGDQYGKYRAFCFEASRYPNGPNLPGVTDAILHPGEEYKSQTIYQLNF
ncbi:galactose mutarotase [Neolewinella aurantiaca]|uniref:Aldose 1-epimerase n=1 Tax=Neolewinella aurantiaca TaxID=2602767 RepID=A0A5C7FCU3_9BACT|nr:aldose epimerase family protein [Neolewinella aurantiaca]TXF87909.1 galactose mutarotase [Neolewinella aurantiaca]